MMDPDAPSGERDNSRNDSLVNENGQLQPVLPETSGEGFPYAPENFPNPGDNWRWRVGKRVYITGYYRDRYLYAPKRLKYLFKEQHIAKYGFASRLSLVQFIRAAFPDSDIKAFLESFSWKIPSMKPCLENGVPDWHAFDASHEESPEPFSSDPGSVGCKARNRTCVSLVCRSDKLALSLMPCDICCSESNFCRECCCILCSKPVDFMRGGYSFIRCEAAIGEEGSICGHLAHLNCGLRCYMAGTVGGSIGLDAEYYCRRCDSRTELVSHVGKLLETCKSMESLDEIDEILSMGVSLLRGSQKSSAKLLLGSIYSTLSKVKHRNSLEMWREDGNSATPILSNAGSLGMQIDNGSPCLEVSEENISSDGLKEKANLLNESESSSSQMYRQKLETEINWVLQTMRQAQDFEFKIAEEQLHAQKKCLYNLHEQLDHEISELKRQTPSIHSNDLADLVSKRKDQIKREYEKLSKMKAVAKGFGRTSKEILREHFGLELE
ncbi:hypothetical protein SAY87_009555 [Trapa incisa]|uniref:Oberon PHD finger domain-containing protein n=1 Tax=Trapa incisa TaxID=236973 RepID=A0AAN7K1W5_9MYRT|nr:hypothetical protein SAY87_009555 [Trapa incisa]